MDTTWIPNKGELVKWKDAFYVIISVDMGGKCKIKKFTTTKRIAPVFKDIDISELTQIKK